MTKMTRHLCVWRQEVAELTALKNAKFYSAEKRSLQVDFQCP